MNHAQGVRWAALAAATLTGLGLFGLCLGTVQAQAAPATVASPSASQIWHVAATPGEGLAGYWKFDQVFDGVTFNSALLTNTTTLQNGAFITSAVPPTVTVPDFGAVQLNGVSHNAVVSDAAQLDVSPGSFSVAAWVRRATTGTYDAIYDSGSEANKWWVFIADSSKANRFGFGMRGITETYSTRSITDTNWHHLAVVKNGSGPSNLTFYVDGVASGVVTATNVLTPSGDKHIGALLDGSLLAPLRGQIDELRLYNRALSAAEVGRLAAGHGCVTDGTTWASAFDDLQCGFSAAQASDQIWVAAGTYRPGTSNHASYHLVSGVSLLGGFNGSESSPAQRPAFDPNTPLTALSGDAASNDVPANVASHDDNTCNTLVAGNLAFPDPISATVDGLAIEHGNADVGANCVFPSTSNGGGLLILGGSQLTLNQVVFRFNRAAGFGGIGGLGGGLFDDGLRLGLSGVRFFSNTADIGGGLAIDAGSVTVTASSFVSNTANQGGAIDLRPGQGHTTLAVSASSFTANQAQDGGAVEDQVFDGLLDLAFDNDSFASNRAVGGDGGAVSSSAIDPGQVRSRFSQTNFSHNFAAVDSGAISDFGGLLTIMDSQFISNTALFAGAMEAQSVVTVTNSTFMSNTALDESGAVAVFGTLVMSGSSVILNTASDPNTASDFAPVGGGVLVSGTAVITNTQFFSNTAFLQGLFSNLAEGGGLAVTGDLALSGGDFRGNSAEHGGGLYAQGTASIQRSLFQHNRAGSGGGVFADGALTLVNNRLVDNTALETLTNEPSVGGGLLLQNGAFGGRVSNNLFLGNQAVCADFGCSPLGSALAVDGQAILISNNTIVGRGLITASAASLTGSAGLFNNIITSHTVAIEVLGGTTIDDYNLFHGNTNTITATGVISSLGHSRQADPRFQAPPLDDFQVRSDSPAVDAGDNSRIKGIVTTDLSGGPRFVDVVTVPDTGAGSPPIVDIGAYEAVGDQLFLPLVMR